MFWSNATTFAILLVALVACAAEQRAVTPLTPTTTADVAPTVDQTVVSGPPAGVMASDPDADEDDEESLASDDPEAEKEPELAPEDFEDGFCADDIYARFLLSEYKTQHPAPPATASKPLKHRSALSSQPPMDALFFARNHLTGHVAPYFGAIPIVANERVELWLQYFKTAGRREFMQWLVRGESVKKMVQPLLKDSGVPVEFFYLAMVESGFKNAASSRAKATGTWQFMSGTAKRYGLRIDPWVDERRDPVKSSIAAANLLKALYREFGDWYLAMAAYNSGPGKIRSAVRRGHSRDYWQLAKRSLLPRETMQYVPKVLAAIMLASDPRAHGFDFQRNPLDAIPDTEVIVKRPVRLDELARELGLPLRTLQTWNPELIRNITPPKREGYSLRLASAFANKFQAIERKLSLIEITDVQMHTVKKGETLQKIAHLYKVDVKKIMSLNPDLSAKSLRIGRQVAVPVPGVISSVKPAPKPV